MVSNIIKWILLLILLGVLFMIGTCVYANFIREPDLGIPELPKTEEAQYSIHIKNTGGLLLTNSVEKYGDEVGSRIIILNGYWELSGQDFTYRDSKLILDENIFGTITIRAR